MMRRETADGIMTRRGAADRIVKRCGGRRARRPGKAGAKMKHFAAALFAGLVLLPGCTSWHAQQRPARDVVARAETVRVTQKNQCQVVIEQPIVRGDTLAGFATDPRRPVAIPLSEVDRIEVRRLDPFRTGGALVGTAVGVITITTLVIITTYIIVITRM